MKMHPDKLRKGDIVLYDGQEMVIERIYKVNSPGFVVHGDTRWVLRSPKGGPTTETNLAMDRGYGGKVANLKTQLIKLGSMNPELRPHIRPILEGLKTSTMSTSLRKVLLSVTPDTLDEHLGLGGQYKAIEKAQEDLLDFAQNSSKTFKTHWEVLDAFKKSSGKKSSLVQASLHATKTLDATALRSLQDALRSMRKAIEALESGAATHEALIGTPLQEEYTNMRTNVRGDTAKDLRRELEYLDAREDFLVRTLKK